MSPQIYLATATREIMLERHDFFFGEVQSRVLAQFANVDGEADAYLKEEFERLRRRFDDGRHDEADVAEWAHDAAIGFHALLTDLRKQMLLGALAGLYHQWEKDLRDFLERELVRSFEREDVEKLVWKPSLDPIFDCLSQFGWNCRDAAFYADLNACRLVVNVHKHGKGRSLKDLATTYPEFLPGGEPFKSWAFLKSQPHHDWLELTEEQLRRLASALRQFWVEIPERLILSR